VPLVLTSNADEQSIVEREASMLAIELPVTVIVLPQRMLEFDMKMPFPPVDPVAVIVVAMLSADPADILMLAPVLTVDDNAPDSTIVD
jgi:hypothetical protein